MYLEASLAKSKGKKAWLLSQEYSPTVDGRCLQFWYHMYGAHIGELKILTFENGSHPVPIWTLKGSQGNQWKPSRVTIDIATKFQVKIMICSQSKGVLAAIVIIIIINNNTSYIYMSYVS